MLRRIGTRTSAFLVKESVVALSQRRLILSVIVGPFLLLLLFGLGFSGGRAPYDTVLVVPDRPGIPVATAAYRGFFLWSLRLVDVTTDESAALARLRQREVDVVVVAPAHPLRALANDEPAEFHVYYNHLDPVDRAQINGLAFGHSRELNTLIVAAMLDGIMQAAGVQEQPQPALTELREQLLAGDSDGALSVIDRLLAAITILRIAGESGYQVASSTARPAPTTPPLDHFEAVLRALRAEMAPGPGVTPQQEAQLSDLEQTALLLPDVVQAASRISPERLAAPVGYDLTNLAPTHISYLRFYAPVVLMLLLQHVAITLAALSAVRERTRGTVEMFAVAPVRLSEILAGKALSFAAILAVLAIVLLALLVFVLRIPLLGNVALAALVVLLLIAAGLAIGFVIAGLSTTESQAVQLAMLVLLFSTFFGGLFVPLAGLDMPVRAVAYAVPVTHAGTAMRAIMLRGNLVPLGSVAMLAVMVGALAPVAYLLMRRSYRLS